MNIIDSDSDRQQVSFEVEDTALDGSSFSADYTAVVALNDAIAGITLGNLGPMYYQAVESGSAVAPPANNFAQTNIQWIFEYTNNITGARRTTRVGTADLTLANAMYNGAPALDLSSTEGAALKTAFEAIATDDGQPVTLVAVYYRE